MFAAIQSGPADRVKQDVHGVERQSRKGIDFGVVRRVEALLERQPRGIVAIRVERVNRLQPFGGLAGFLDQRIAHHASAAEDRLLHSHLAHFREDLSSRRRIAPDHDAVHARIVDHAQLAGEGVVPGSVLLFDHHRMAQPPRGVAELDHAEAAVSLVDAQKGHAL